MVVMSNRSLATNEWVAQQLGLTHSMISRIRSGDRRPSIEVMGKIQERFHWSLNKQLEARREGNYAAQFELILGRQYG